VRSGWRRTGAIASGAYADNFIGVRFVPEEFIARFEAGEPIEQIAARPPLAADS